MLQYKNLEKKESLHWKVLYSCNIRMIKFGADSGGGKLAVKLKDPEAKAAFKSRH